MIYSQAGQVNWEVGGWLAARSILGACLAVPMASSPKAQRAIYRALRVAKAEAEGVSQQHAEGVSQQ